MQTMLATLPNAPGWHSCRAVCHHADDADCWIYASRYSPRWMLLFGCPCSRFAIPYDDLRSERGFPYHDHGARLPGGRLSCLFMPINIAAYASLPREKNNALPA